MIYADTSALVRAYFVDEPGHEALRARILDGDEPVVTSEVARVELTSAVRSAARSGRLADWEVVARRFDADCGAQGQIALIALRPDPVLRRARDLIAAHALHTLDAVHLAVALEDGAEIARGEELAFMTRDERQAEAAEALGLDTA